MGGARVRGQGENERGGEWFRKLKKKNDILTVVRKEADGLCIVVSPCKHTRKSCTISVIKDSNVSLLHVLCIGGAIRRAF